MPMEGGGDDEISALFTPFAEVSWLVLLTSEELSFLETINGTTVVVDGDNVCNAETPRKRNPKRRVKVKGWR